jgi:hypothetical protein
MAEILRAIFGMAFYVLFLTLIGLFIGFQLLKLQKKIKE